MTRQNPYNAQLQERDVALLKGLFESRIMTLGHAAANHFGGSIEAAKKRVQKLKSAGFVAERPRRAYQPSILFLARRAFTTLAEGGYLDEYPPLAWSNLEKRARVSELTLRHELAVMDFKAAVLNAARLRRDLRVAEFLTWPLLYEFEARPRAGSRSVAVRPDGFLRVNQSSLQGDHDARHTFYVEVDRSTEVLTTLTNRALCYRDHYRSGGLAARDGRPRAEWREHAFRVLIVLRNAERRNNLADRLLRLRPPVLAQTWLSTYDEAVADPFGAVWVTPQDYRDAVSGTGHFASSDTLPYVRDDARDAFIERVIVKRRPLPEPPDAAHRNQTANPAL